MTRDWIAFIRRLSPRALERMKERIIENKRKWYALQLARGRPPSNRMHAYLYGRASKPQPSPTTPRPTRTGPVLSHPYSPPLHGSRKVKVVWRRNGKIVTGTEVRTVDRDVQTAAPVRVDTSSQKRAHDNNMLPDYDENEYSAPSAKRQRPPAQKEEADTAPMKKRALPKKNNARRIQVQRKYRNSKPVGVSNSAMTPWVPPADTPIGRFIDEQIKQIRTGMPMTSTATKPAPECDSGNNCSSELKAGPKSNSDSSSDESDSESDTESDTDSSGISSDESGGEEDDVSGKCMMVSLQIPKNIPTVSKIDTQAKQAQPPVSGSIKAATSGVFKDPTSNDFRAPTSQKKFKIPCVPVQRLISLFQSKLSLAAATTTTKPAAAKQAGPDDNPFKQHLKNHNVLKRTCISHQCAQLNKRWKTFSFPPSQKFYFGTKARFGLLSSPVTTDLVSTLNKQC